MAETQKQKLDRELRKLRVEQDCVVIIKPDEGCVFHIPDRFKEDVKAGGKLPNHVMVLLTMVQMLADHEDPKVKDFMTGMLERALDTIERIGK